MSREKECYRDNLERLEEAFPDKEILCISDVVRYTGKNYRTVKKRFPFKGCEISKVVLARALS